MLEICLPNAISTNIFNVFTLITSQLPPPFSKVGIASVNLQLILDSLHRSQLNRYTAIIQQTLKETGKHECENSQNHNMHT